MLLYSLGSAVTLEASFIYCSNQQFNVQKNRFQTKQYSFESVLLPEKLLLE